MSREIKFRAWFTDINKMGQVVTLKGSNRNDYNGNMWGEVTAEIFINGRQNFYSSYNFELMAFTGLKDKNGKEIWEGDVLEFADKWEWHKSSYGIKMRFAEGARLTELQEMYDAEPMERRVIQIPECYEWLLSSEIQTYWHVIGNIHENTNLLQ